ncbi:hypothetical protein N7462_006291 [Penicillium macrosclerotiorum]|uniref:uncharacterized protein n=1 Tax=Penicillium macrosclerotiorum TaxID=303699 RepID=UPI0025465EA0|nr:uncharacterized protein N7462_006291 [Penicillium macrosclerotiorum]KAJ5683126.1 hypothetical protein N7462_006291 [Penicillium macrosclerotiorum]
MERARGYGGHRCVVFRLFVTEDLTREEAKLAFEEQTSELRLTIHQWKKLLRDLGIFKNIRGEDAVRAKAILDQTLDGHHCLVFADGVLQENEEVIRHCDRRKDLPKEKSDSRELTWIRLPFQITMLSDPTAFRSFQYLLFNTRVHFESCFDSGEWAPNHKGLYARSTELRAQLAGLSRLHNMVFRALRQIKADENQRADALLNSSFALHRSVVGYRHHRQLPDILGILLMVKRAGNEELQHCIIANLVSMARHVLPQNDPRRLMLEFLEKIDWEQLCPLYLAFDSYCRFLWMNRAGNDPVKGYLSYNQARFPRADAGEFYSLYKGLSVFEIEDMLNRIDLELGKYSHETMTLWHTAMEYLWSERDQDPQLNHDVSTTFLLLGLAQEAQGHPYTARLSFKQAAEVRDSIIPGDQWDAAREGALSKWVEVDRRVGELHTANTNSMLIDMMYTAI